MRDFLIRKIIKETVKQGNHQQKLEDFLAEVIKIFREEFPEDNHVTQDVFLRECLENALKRG